MYFLSTEPEWALFGVGIVMPFPGGDMSGGNCRSVRFGGWWHSVEAEAEMTVACISKEAGFSPAGQTDRVEVKLMNNADFRPQLHL